MTSTPHAEFSTSPAPHKAGQSWYVRPYQPGDEFGLIQLFERVFGRPRSIQHLKWKLLTRNTRPVEMVWVAVEHESEKIVGHYGGIPLEMKLLGRIVPAVHSVEAMADPNYRRQGILTALGKEAHEEWRRHGFELVIGLPNDKWGTRNAALGYVPLFPLSWLRFPLRLDRVINRRLRIRAIGSAIDGPARMASHLWRVFHGVGHPQDGVVSVSAIDLGASGHEIDDLWESLAREYPNAVRRSSRWLRWRYAEEPTEPFKLLISRIGSRPTGLVAYRTVRAVERITGYVADLFVSLSDLPSARALLCKALDDLDKSGVGSVLAAMPPGSTAYSQLAKIGFRPLQTGFSFEIVPLSTNIELHTIRDPSQWHLTAGDFDIV